MIILGLDSCSRLCQSILVRWEQGQAQTLASISLDLGMGHAENLFPMLETLFEEAGVDQKEVERIAVTTGPGSFTGVRVGLSAAKGMALALKCDLVAVSSLELALHSADIQEGEYLVAIDALRDQFYTQKFELTSGTSDKVPYQIKSFAPQLIEAVDIHETVTPNSNIITNNSAKVATMLKQIEAFRIDEAKFDCATLVAQSMKREPNSNPLVPIYLRSADAKEQKGFAVSRI